MGTAEITRKRATEKRPEQKDGDIFLKNKRERTLEIGYKYDKDRETF